MQAFRPEANFAVTAPLTPERVLMSLYGERCEQLRGLSRGDKVPLSGSIAPGAGT
jgi:hypothetical protein